MGRFDRYTDDELEDDDFIAALLGAQEEGDSALPRVPGPYDHLSDEEASDPDVLDALLGAQEEGDTTATMRSPYSVDIGEAQLRPEAPQVSMAPQAPAVPRAPQGPQGPSGAPAPMSRKAGDALAKQQEQTFQRNAKGGWDSSQYGDVESIAADDPSIAKLNHNSAPFKDQGSRPGARIDAITGQPLEGADELDGLLEEEPPMQSRMDVGPVEMLSGDGIGANPYHEDDDALSELAGEVPQAPQAPVAPQAQQAPQDPGQMAYAQRVAEARRAGELFRQRQQSEPQEDYERYAHEASQGYRQTDEDLQRMWSINTIFGNKDDNFKAVAMGRQMQDAYDQRMQHGQNLDQRYAQHRQPAPTDADAELLALNWNVSPESAAGGRVNPDLVKGIGPTASRRDLQDSKSADAAAGNAMRREVGASHDAATRYRADKNFEGQTMRQEAKGSVDVEALSASTLVDVAKIPFDDAMALVKNPELADQLPPELRSRVKSTIAQMSIVSKDAGKAQSFVSRVAGGNASQVNAYESRAADPQFAHKETEKYEEIAAPFQDAFEAALRLKKSGKLDLVTTYGTDGYINSAAKLKATPDDQGDAGAVRKFGIDYAHGKFGAAFSKSEQAMMAEGTGIVVGKSVKPLNDPKILLRFMENTRRVLIERKQRLPQAGIPGVAK